MSERTFRRSLYWRIGLAIVSIIAAVLLVQAASLAWWVAGMSDFAPPRALNHLAARVASEAGELIEHQPDADLTSFVRERFQQIGRPLAIVLRDGRTVASSEDLPEWVTTAGRARIEGFGRERRLLGLAPITVRGAVVGAVVVLAGRPPGAVLRALGPLLAVIVLALTLGGAATAALLVFRPAHRRLRALEDAARSLESGNAAARAPSDGGDEIAAVAVAFNAMADQLTTRMREIETVDRARRQLIADVSHELMTPLTSMRGYVETLRMTNLNLDAASRERYLDIVHEEALRLERIVGDLLEVARLSAGGTTIEMEDVDVEELFGRVCDRHGPAAREKAIELRTEIADGAATVRGDAHRLEQALQNLAANALRHTPQGGHVTLRAAKDGGSLVFSVEDDGEGIPVEHQAHVFERFYKVDAVRGASGGSGLGLSIVKAIVERHGGRVAVASAPGRGTVFEIRLPAGDTLGA